MQRSICLIIAGLAVSIASASVFGQSTLEDILSTEGFSLAAERVSAPNFVLESLDGTTTDLKDHQGRVVFLNFWATWCGPCRVEMPSMQRLFDQIDPSQFSMLAVNLNEYRDTVSAFADELGLSFPILLDSTGIVGAQYGISGIPTTYLIDKNGLLVARLIGSREWDTRGFIDALNRLMAE